MQVYEKSLDITVTYSVFYGKSLMVKTVTISNNNIILELGFVFYEKSLINTIST